MGDSWYNTGFEGIGAEQARIEANQGPQRFFVPKGQEKELVFVDDDPFCLYEHSPKINGTYRNWMTCLQGVHEDAVCCKIVGPQSRYYCGYLTVVDCSRWKDSKGNEHQYELRLICAKMKVLKKFRRKKETIGALSGHMFNAIREDGLSPQCGDEFEHRREVNMEKLFPLVTYRGKKLMDLWAEAEDKPEAMASVTRTFQIKPDENGQLPRVIPAFNYFQLLKPKEPKEAKILLSRAEIEDNDRRRPYGQQSSSDTTLDDQDVPF